MYTKDRNKYLSLLQIACASQGSILNYKWGLGGGGSGGSPQELFEN